MYVFLDTETTGLNLLRRDEILQISLIEETGKVLFHSLLKPVIVDSWDEAQEINGITKVKSAKSIHCCMNAYSEYKQVWLPSEERYKRFKLSEAINELDPNFSYKAHDSLEDCKATLRVWNFLMTQKNIKEKYGVKD